MWLASHKRISRIISKKPMFLLSGHPFCPTCLRPFCQLIFIVDQVIGALNANPTLLKLISKHLSWGMFKNSLVEPIDDAQRNIYDIYMDLLKNSGHEFDHPEVMIYMIIEMVAGSCYNVILTGEPVSVDELKPYLYQSIRLIIQNHIL